MLVLTFAGAVPARPESPMLASPGSSSGFTLVAGPCPTFSWGSVPDADRYELALYSVAADGSLEPDAGLHELLPGSVNAWTPSLERCPAAGGSYAWTLRAWTEGVATRWSKSRLFQLSDTPSVTEVEEALEVLRRYTGRPMTATDPSPDSLLLGPRAATAPAEDAQQPSSPSSGAERASEVARATNGQPQALLEALLSSTLSTTSTSPRTVDFPANYSLRLDSDLVLEGAIFKEGYSLLHTDGGYDSGNTALGFDALVSSTPDVPNLGDGEFNSAFGNRALRNNTTGKLNTSIGGVALYENTTGSYNLAVGALALASNTSGSHNLAASVGALYSNTIGERNVALGPFALVANVDSRDNIAIGYRASEGTTRYENIAIGSYALAADNNGILNVAVGDRALSELSIASFNVAVGGDSLRDNDTGLGNVALGYRALTSLTIGDRNVAIGRSSASGLEDGERNVAIGGTARVGTAANRNIAIGYSSGGSSVGDDNIYLGALAGSGDSETIRIGNTDTHTATFVAGIRGATVGSGLQVLVGGQGRLGTSTSSRRFKEEIRPMGDTSAALLTLSPVTFRYTEAATGDGERPLEFGLIAEEVADLYPDLVAYDDDGKPYSVRYHLLPAMLLNELQKLHGLLMEQQRELLELRAKLHPGRQRLATHDEVAQ